MINTMALNISDSILSYFKNNWDDLSWKKRRHFAYRAGIISNDSFWKNELNKTSVETGRNYERLLNLSQLDRDNYYKKNSFVLSGDKSNDKHKKEVIEKYPQVIFWDEVLTDIRYMHLIDGKIPMDLEGEIERVLMIAFDESTMKNFPVWSIERIYDALWFFSIDKTDEIRNIFLSVYDSSNLDEGLSLNYWYGLTHVVLGEAHFYQKMVEKNWAVDLIVGSYEKLISDFSIDLAAEVGVCLLLAGVNNLVDFSLLEDRISRELNKDLGFVPRGEITKINKLEHRNIMTAMSLTFPRR